MKPAPFEYHRAASVPDALDALANGGEEPRILAGGQSLIPMLNFRLAQPSTLVDLGGVEELRYISTANGNLRIGAMTRQADALASPEVWRRWPLVAQALQHVGHTAIRNAGTVGGSIAHADPAAELPVAAVALDARVHLQSQDSSRVVAAGDFFDWYYTTTIEEGEILVEVEFPELPPGTGTSFVEFARRAGDFALGGCAATVTVDAERRCLAASLVLLGGGPRPVVADSAAAALLGSVITDDTAVDASRLIRDAAEPPDDHHGSREYRLGLLEHLARRAVTEAADRAERNRDD